MLKEFFSLKSNRLCFILDYDPYICFMSVYLLRVSVINLGSQQTKLTFGFGKTHVVGPKVVNFGFC